MNCMLMFAAMCAPAHAHVELEPGLACKTHRFISKLALLVCILKPSGGKRSRKIARPEKGRSRAGKTVAQNRATGKRPVAQNRATGKSVAQNRATGERAYMSSRLHENIHVFQIAGNVRA
jgi:hypothetical protein